MAAPRFFVPARARARSMRARRVELPRGAAHHATRVLRLAVGDALTLFDGAGGEYAATLVRIDKRGGVACASTRFDAGRARVAARGDARAGDRGERRDGLRDPQGDRARRDGDPAARHRAQRAAAGRRARRQAPRALAADRVAACEQCGRNRVPRRRGAARAGRLASAMAGTRHRARCRTRRGRSRRLPQPVAAGRAADRSRRRIRRSARSTRRARRDCARVSLGPRVLRTETAAVAALAALQSLWGDLR